MLPALLLAAALTGSLDVTYRGELRARVTGAASSAASIDVENGLTVGMLLGSRRFRYTLAYDPRFVIWDLNAGTRQATLVHGGVARIEWRDKRMRVSLEQTGRYGGVSLASTSLVPGVDGASPRMDVVPTVRVLNLSTLVTTLSSQITRRRWGIDATIGYQRSGGADAVARAFLPEQAGPFARLTGAWAASRRDRLSASLSASEVVFSSGSESVLVEQSQELRRLLTRQVEARLTLGVSVAHTRPTARADYAFSTHPVAEIAFERHPARLENNLDIRLGLRLGPMINRQLGVIDDRLQATLGASTVRRDLTARAFASASRSVPATDPFSMTLLAGELGLAYALSDMLSVDVGVRGLWQRQALSRVTVLQGTAFAGVTLRAPRTRL